MSLQFLTRTAVLLAIALAVQWLRLPTYFTGPVVNAVLILATLFSGIWSGIIIGCITPVVALLMGIIPPAAIPLVPLIIAANITLVLVFFFLDKANRYVAWIGSAFAKYGMFYVGLRLLLHLFGVKLPAPLLLAFQIPQLYTALVGGLTAVIIARYLKQRMD
ncbi:hypothetical protein DCMF_01580 [Candidatus Formimonas warabiya]|uniref:ECF transporter S component n=2 Tax=Formimonas warabiya TaxID=1761012 RepID=A0A3G1L0V0_FORW1|nr:hypothetical protein DCMF_01580 [Candidatus Formimonas warabiya]